MFQGPKSEESMFENFLITFQGIVQGVGFRPFVFRAAKKFGIKGNVKNDFEGVSINVFSSQKNAQNFYEYILENAPEKSKIISKSISPASNEVFQDFRIIENSQKKGISNLSPTPDFEICESCKKEILDPKNRRYLYAFTTCATCGPRYSIQHALPFERENTSMAGFEFCEDCQSEYTDSEDVRFHAQTISCKKCGISLSLYDNKKNKIELSQDLILDEIVANLKLGKIIAIKGIGGFLLLADASNSETIQTLRERKNRPSKPFAVLIENIEKIKEEAKVSSKEFELLESPIAPILLLPQKKTDKICTGINPKMGTIGIMLPYSPLLVIISQKFGSPLLATSGNVSGIPIVFENEMALNELSKVADLIITNNRDIVMPQDDSVVKFSQKHQQKVIIRRSRGFENGIRNFEKSPQKFLAMGASLKSTFALKTGSNIYISQYLGDLENFETQQNYSLVLEKFLDFFTENQEKSPVDKVITDLHPNYFSTQIGKSMAEDFGVPTQSIQHHEAHFSAILAEHNLLETKEKILGVIWDGTGYGTDGQIWGGDFFVFQNSHIERIQHFEYFESILSDKMAKEPRISALSLLTYANISTEFIKQKFTNIEFGNYSKILKTNTLKTCSVGRIFDGVASLLDLKDVQTFEGEAAMLLEEMALSYFLKNEYIINESYFSENKNFLQSLIEGIVSDLEISKEKDFIAAKFHFSLVEMIEYVANTQKIDNIAFSGGVFQNTVLIDLIIEHLNAKFNLYFHKELSPNDESISFGQIFHPSLT